MISEYLFTKMISELFFKNNPKTDFKFCALWLVDEENFEIHQICIFSQNLFENNCIKQMCKKCI